MKTKMDIPDKEGRKRLVIVVLNRVQFLFLTARYLKRENISIYVFVRRNG